MLRAQIFVNNVRTAFEHARKQFFNAKRDDFEYKPVLVSRLVPLAPVDVARARIGSTNVTRFEYGGKP